MIRPVLVACLLTALTSTPALAGQAQPPGQGLMPSPALSPPVQLQVVISRTRAEKKVASMPYLLSVKAGDRLGAQLRLGSQIPISTTVNDKQTVIFRDIGTSMDAQVQLLQDGRYAVTLNIEETAVYGDTQEPFKLQVITPAPVTRLYRASNTLYMRDGQTSQFGVATDPMSGETVRVDVTLNVTK